jgi:polyphosphate kinase
MWSVARRPLPVIATPRMSVEETPQSIAKASIRYYQRELARLHVELVKQQEYIRATGHKVVVIFEGRDAAGKGGAIQRIIEPLNRRAARIVALAAPTKRERGGERYFNPPRGATSAARP